MPQYTALVQTVPKIQRVLSSKMYAASFAVVIVASHDDNELIFVDGNFLPRRRLLSSRKH